MKLYGNKERERARHDLWAGEHACPIESGGGDMGINSEGLHVFSSYYLPNRQSATPTIIHSRNTNLTLSFTIKHTASYHTYQVSPSPLNIAVMPMNWNEAADAKVSYPCLRVCLYPCLSTDKAFHSCSLESLPQVKALNSSTMNSPTGWETVSLLRFHAQLLSNLTVFLFRLHCQSHSAPHHQCPQDDQG